MYPNVIAVGVRRRIVMSRRDLPQGPAVGVEHTHRIRLPAGTSMADRRRGAKRLAIHGVVRGGQADGMHV